MRSIKDAVHDDIGLASGRGVPSNAQIIATPRADERLGARGPRQACALDRVCRRTPDFTLTPLAALIDALRTSADAGPGSRQIHCRWTIMGPDMEAVTSSCGVRIEPRERFRDPAGFDYIARIGGVAISATSSTTCSKTSRSLGIGAEMLDWPVTMFFGCPS